MTNEDNQLSSPRSRKSSPGNPIWRRKVVGGKIPLTQTKSDLEIGGAINTGRESTATNAPPEIDQRTSGLTITVNDNDNKIYIDGDNQSNS